MDNADELAKFIAGYLQTVCDSHICGECPFFNPTPTNRESFHCGIIYANSILKARGLDPLW